MKNFPKRILLALLLSVSILGLAACSATETTDPAVQEEAVSATEPKPSTEAKEDDSLAARCSKVWEQKWAEIELDGVVSNAGIGMGGTPLHEYDVTDYEKIFALNSEGVFAGMKYGAEAILKSHSEGGFLINVASIAGLVPQRGQALYSATKFGVVGMTRAAALDYAAYGITVNAICPGYTKTSIFGDAPASAMDFFASDCPAKRMGDPEECAALALFLASDMARYITGAAIPVDGALSAGHQSISSWKHPEILTDGKLNSQSTIAALMENDAAKVVIENFLPGFSANEQAKAAYGMTFAQIGPMLGLPDSALQGLLAALDNL